MGTLISRTQSNAELRQSMQSDRADARTDRMQVTDRAGVHKSHISWPLHMQRHECTQATVQRAAVFARVSTTSNNTHHRRRRRRLLLVASFSSPHISSSEPQATVASATYLTAFVLSFNLCSENGASSMRIFS